MINEKFFVYRLQVFGIISLVLCFLDIIGESFIPVLVLLFIPIYTLISLRSLYLMYTRQGKLVLEDLAGTRIVIFVNLFVALVYYSMFIWDPNADIASLCGCGSKGDQSILDSGEYYWGWSPPILAVLNLIKIHFLKRTSAE